MAITTSHTLLTASWTAVVEALEADIGRLRAEPLLTNDCRIAFFEIVGSEHLHVNVTHRYPTKTMAGWAGPGPVHNGFVHNRTFDGATHSQIVRHIRNMVFAARVK